MVWNSILGRRGGGGGGRIIQIKQYLEYKKRAIKSMTGVNSTNKASQAHTRKHHGKG